MTKRAKKATFADRFLALKGDESYQALAAKLNKKGFDISAQALHKYAHGGGISADSLEQLASYFGVPPAELFFGEQAPPSASSLSTEGQLIGWAWGIIPERFKDELRRDIITLASGYATPVSTEPEATLYRRLQAAMRELKR